MSEVIVRRGNIEEAIRTLRRKVNQDGTLAQVRLRGRSDPKPSVRKRIKLRSSEKRRKRRMLRRGDRVWKPERMALGDLFMGQEGGEI